jgi:(1->4)-alpha-D-glucan 1-alpha-D-glucosylmutase
VRSRIAALSWMVEEWAGRVYAWHDALGGLADAREELLVYQTLVGALPIERHRLDGYLQKALREGKVNTNWLSPNEEHERAVLDYARRAAALISDDPFVERVRAIGRRLSLAQLLLKLTAPGVPDIYRGDELEDLSLVDPDNRRPVDWQVRRDALRALQEGAPVDVSNAKLYVIWKTLGVRAEHGAAFAGSYAPVDAGEGICAFIRGDEVFVGAAVRPCASVEVPDGWCEVLGVEGLAVAVRGRP